MAGGAVSCEKCLPSLGVATVDGVAVAVEAAVGGEFDLEMDVFGDVVDLVVVEVGKGGHSALGTAVLNDLADVFAFFVVENEDGAYKVRALGSAGGGAVASGTVLFVEGLAEFGGGGVGSRAEAEEVVRVAGGSSAGGGLLVRLLRVGWYGLEIDAR